MIGRDFFGFCTSLKPIELRAIGALSHVRHLGTNETIYSTGDSADTLFIINRGVVEIVQEGRPRNAAATYLSRGDIFGEVEVLTGLPRNHSVYTREDVSMQCFPSEHFPALVQRVPSFFRYLSGELAARILKTRDVAVAQSHCLELSGSLANFDLVTIYQTIVHSSKTGELSIADERGEPTATFRFEQGRPCGGQFEHLIGEEAFWQLFLAQELRGTFSFSSTATNVTDVVQGGAFSGEPDDLLIKALQMRDELDAIRAEMPDGSSLLLRQRLNFEREDLEAEVVPLAGRLWHVASGGRLRLDQVYRRLDVCEFKIYRALAELLRTGHLELACAKPLSQPVLV